MPETETYWEHCSRKWNEAERVPLPADYMIFSGDDDYHCDIWSFQDHVEQREEELDPEDREGVPAYMPYLAEFRAAKLDIDFESLVYEAAEMPEDWEPSAANLALFAELNAYINQKLAENRIGCYHSTNKVPDCYPPSMKDVASVTP